MNATHIHIFYTDASNGWCALQLDSEGHQVGEGNYHYRKADAVKDAKRNGLPVHLFGRNGLLQRVIGS